MQCIIFIGIPASGKSSFYKEHYFNSHIRVSIDLLNTRNKESKLIDFCFSTQSRFVFDNTNVTKEERAKYISVLKEKKYEIIGFYFEVSLDEAITRNSNRKETIPEVGIRAKMKQLELPSLEEGFDKIVKVTIVDNQFKKEDYEI